jgi:hypothetical protein
MIPVRTLERLGPGRTRRRKKALSGGGIDFCVFLSVWSLVLEAILLGGEILFVLISLMMIQSGFISSPGDFFAGKEILLYTAWCVNGIFVESLYVCMGFSLYINSRVEVEGWDLELLFRGLRRSRRENSGPRTAGGAGGRGGIGAVILAICLFAAPPSAFAEEPPPPVPPNQAVFSGTEDAPLEKLQDILASPEFGGEKESWGIRFRNRKEPENRFFNPAPWLPFVERIFALILRALLVLGFLALGIFCALYLYRLRRPGEARNRGKTSALRGEKPKTPEELLSEALDLYRAGSVREAWARCFAASLAAWSRYGGLSFPAGATEYRCLALVRGVPVRAVPETAPALPDQAEGPDSAARRGFAELITHWVALAYGGRPPPEGAFEGALAWIGDLCGALEDRESLP